VALGRRRHRYGCEVSFPDTVIPCRGRDRDREVEVETEVEVEIER
jgi:hypothetical protein